MRELTLSEVSRVSGAADQCSNTVGGISDFSIVGDQLISFYEGLIAATSYMIERVAESF